MAEIVERRALKDVVAEASLALARLDADRLEELAASCQLLNRELQTASGAERERLRREAQAAAGEMAIYGRVLEATRANLNVIERLRELGAGSLEYGPRSAAVGCGWTAVEGVHGDD